MLVFAGGYPLQDSESQKEQGAHILQLRTTVWVDSEMDTLFFCQPWNKLIWQDTCLVE